MTHYQIAAAVLCGVSLVGFAVSMKHLERLTEPPRMAEPIVWPMVRTLGLLLIVLASGSAI